MVCVLEPSSTDLILILILGRLSSPVATTNPAPGASFGFSMSWFFRFRLRLCSFAGDPSSWGDRLRCFSFFRLLCLCDEEDEEKPVPEVPAVAVSVVGGSVASEDGLGGSTGGGGGSPDATRDSLEVVVRVVVDS